MAGEKLLHQGKVFSCLKEKYQSIVGFDTIQSAPDFV
jgi:hypothetical protein